MSALRNQLWLKFFLVVASVLLLSGGWAAEIVSNYSDEILRMAEEDQEVRQLGDRQQMMVIDAENTSRLKELVEQHGWPRISEHGPRVAHAAWLIAQHAVNDREFQKEVLLYMRNFVRQGEAIAIDLAYLEDRVSMMESGTQVYGTQGICEGGKFEIYPVVDEAGLDERRASLGLMSIAEYKAEGSEILCAD